MNSKFSNIFSEFTYVMSGRVVAPDGFEFQQLLDFLPFPLAPSVGVLFVHFDYG